MKTIIQHNFLAFVLLVGLSLEARAHELKLSYIGEATALKSLMNEASDYYPQEMQELITKKIKIKVAHLNKEKFQGDYCDDQYSFIKVNANQLFTTITVDPELNEAYQKNSVISCGHGNSKLMAVGLVIRSLAQILDKEVKLSKNTRFLNLSGWISKGLLIKKRRNLNADFDRLFDDEEVKSKTLTMAINTELYLMDQNYGCKRLNLNDFFNEFYSLNLNKEKECSNTYSVVLNQKNILKTTDLLREIDIDRIYQIHYLFAGKGKEKMSKWGHSMFRLVICAPGKEVGPGCLQDIKEHIVISFRADIDELKMSYLKGITGAYKSQMFLMNLMEVIDEYTVGEFRDVTSLPIHLSRAQIKSFTHSALELFWSYKGKYYFFTNNCATEAMNLLRSAYPDSTMMQKKNILTPLSLYNFLLKQNLVDSSILDNKEEAIYKGYLFEGVTKQLQTSLEYFVKLKKNVADNLEELEKISGEERLALYEKGIKKFNDSKGKRMALANALRVENKIYQALNNRFNKAVISLVTDDKENSKIDKETLEKIEKELSALFFRNALDGNLSHGYGIAMDDEIDSVAIREFTKASTEMNDAQEEISAFLAEYFPEMIQKLADSKNNKAHLISELNKIIFNKN